jgi:hypothetical protein
VCYVDDFDNIGFGSTLLFATCFLHALRCNFGLLLLRGLLGAFACAICILLRGSLRKWLVLRGSLWVWLVLRGIALVLLLPGLLAFANFGLLLLRGLLGAFAFAICVLPRGSLWMWLVLRGSLRMWLVLRGIALLLH